MNRVTVNPEILRWAGQRAGLALTDLRAKFPKVSSWLEGDLSPTLKQLEAFARATHTPIGFFFMPKPPEISLPIPDFRTMGGEARPVPSPDLLDTIYLCQQRQDWYRDYARLYGEDPIAWIGQGTVDADIVTTAATLRKRIGLDLLQRQGVPTWTEGLRQLISLLEDTGILVMISGIVGSTVIASSPLRSSVASLWSIRWHRLFSSMAPTVNRRRCSLLSMNWRICGLAKAACPTVRWPNGRKCMWNAGAMRLRRKCWSLSKRYVPSIVRMSR